jgi:hypothetical protein
MSPWNPGDTHLTHADGTRCPHKLTSRQRYNLTILHEESIPMLEIFAEAFGEAWDRMFPDSGDPERCIYCGGEG